METTIVVSLVAAVVSLIAMLVNLHIARRTRDATRIQIATGAAMATAQEAVRYLRKYTADIEKLRAEATLLAIALDKDVLGRNVAKTPMELWNRAEAFENEFHEFFRGWADVKADVPETWIDYLRILRHECKNAALSVVATIRSAKAKAYGKEIPEKDRKELQSVLRHLSTQLDHFFTHMNNVRNDKLTDLIVPELVDPKLEKIVEAHQRKRAEQRVAVTIAEQGAPANRGKQGASNPALPGG